MKAVDEDDDDGDGDDDDLYFRMSRCALVIVDFSVLVLTYCMFHTVFSVLPELNLSSWILHPIITPWDDGYIFFKFRPIVVTFLPLIYSNFCHQVYGKFETLAKELTAVQRQFKLEDDVMEQCNFGLMEVVYEWARGVVGLFLLSLGGEVRVAVATGLSIEELNCSVIAILACHRC